MTDVAREERLDALERRGDELERFSGCQRQANSYLASEGSQVLVDELREAREGRRCIKLGTINALILLAHIDRIEDALANVPLVKP